MRLIIVNKDLSGQTIAGQPFSYIGNCTGTDVKFTGDWRFVSHYRNNFVRPDWSGAQTRYSYSRFNTFTGAVVSPDVELLDHEMMLAMFQARAVALTGKTKTAVTGVVSGLATDKQQGQFPPLVGNPAPPFRRSVRQPVGGDDGVQGCRGDAPAPHRPLQEDGEGRPHEGSLGRLHTDPDTGRGGRGDRLGDRGPQPA